MVYQTICSLRYSSSCSFQMDILGPWTASTLGFGCVWKWAIRSFHSHFKTEKSLQLGSHWGFSHEDFIYTAFSSQPRLITRGYQGRFGSEDLRHAFARAGTPKGSAGGAAQMGDIMPGRRKICGAGDALGMERYHMISIYIIFPQWMKFVQMWLLLDS